MRLRREEVLRKVLHLFSGALVPGLLFLPPLGEALRPALAGALLLLLLGAELLRLRFAPAQGLFVKICGPALRPEERGRMTGATHLMAGVFLCSVLFIGRPEVSFMALCAFIWGDAAAALVGQSLGRVRIGKKSLEGSMACFLLCLFLFAWAFGRVPGLLEKRLPFPAAAAAALCVCLLELIPLRLNRRISLDDNLVVPPLSGLLLMILLR
jgi:dolichol kinase